MKYSNIPKRANHRCAPQGSTDGIQTTIIAEDQLFYVIYLK